MSSFVFIAFQFLAMLSSSASAPVAAWTPPVGNKTALEHELAPGWVSEPNGRGTWSLLYSCVFTLALCVYSAIHLNVPPSNESNWAYYGRKAKWVGIATFAPELLLFIALSQWYEAKSLCVELNSKNVEFGSQHPEFSLVYGYFVIQGGFVVDISDSHDSQGQLTLTSSGILLLADRGHFLKMSTESIRDKSKANLLAKGLIFFQVSWMVVQAIARKASGYPLALLELHTLVHISCALIIYLLWNKKPMDIRDPTLVTDQSLKDTVALMAMLSTAGGWQDSNEMRRIYDFKTGLDLEALYLWSRGQLDESSSIHSSEASELQSSGPPLPEKVAESSGAKANVDSPPPLVTDDASLTKDKEATTPVGAEMDVDQSHSVLATGGSLKRGEILPNGFGILDWAFLPACDTIKLSHKDVLRWNAAAGALLPDNKITSYYIRKGRRAIRKDLVPRCVSSLHLKKRSPNFNLDMLRSLDAMSREWGLPILGVLFLVCAAYGGIHLSAWNFEFPSHAEQVLWRISGIISVVGGLVAPAVAIFLGWTDDRRPTDLSFANFSNWLLEALVSIIGGVHRNDLRHLPFLLLFSSFIIGLFMLPVVLAARAFLVIESFISLRHVPAGCYATVDWVTYIPHI